MPLGFLGWEQTLSAIIAALVFVNVGLVVRMVGTVWERLAPRAEQAAAALGASPLRTAATVTLPALGGSRYATLEVEIWLQATKFLNLRAAFVLTVLPFALVAIVLWVSARAHPRQGGTLRLAAHGRSPAHRQTRTAPGAVRGRGAGDRRRVDRAAPGHNGRRVVPPRREVNA
ncbi:hypothetical protein [Streptomyces shenzhenensis]|uniref:hypothetical protein n=1 Tax=Streptomyces shenzhenensis TaxID=943815 RepID=UPI0034039414